MVIAAIVAIVIYGALLYLIEMIELPEPGPRIAKIAVSLGFLIYMLELFGAIHLLR